MLLNVHRNHKAYWGRGEGGLTCKYVRLCVCLRVSAKKQIGITKRNIIKGEQGEGGGGGGRSSIISQSLLICAIRFVCKFPFLADFTFSSKETLIALFCATAHRAECRTPKLGNKSAKAPLSTST